MWCFRRHANFYTSVFRMTCLDTHPTQWLQHLLCCSLAPSINLEDVTSGGLISLCDLEESSPLFSFQESREGVSVMAPISRNPSHCLEYLVTSDWQGSPPSCCCLQFLAEPQDARGVEFAFLDATGLTLCCLLSLAVSLVPLGGPFKRVLGPFPHLHKFPPRIKCPFLFSAHPGPTHLWSPASFRKASHTNCLSLLPFPLGSTLCLCMV